MKRIVTWVSILCAGSLLIGAALRFSFATLDQSKDHTRDAKAFAATIAVNSASSAQKHIDDFSLPAQESAIEGSTIDQITADPKSMVAKMRSRYAGRELAEKLLEIGRFIDEQGTLEALHSFMQATDMSGMLTIQLASLVADKAKHEKNAEALLRYASDWKEDADGEMVIGTLLSAAGAIMGLDDLDKYLSSGTTLSPSERSQLFAGASAEDPTAALNWIRANGRTLIPLGQMPATIGGLAGRVSIADLVSTASYATERDGKPQNGLVAQILRQSVSSYDPRDIVNFLNSDGQILSEDDKSAAAQSLAVSWGGHDLLAVTDWINGLPDGPVKDHAIYGMLNAAHNKKDVLHDIETWHSVISNEQLKVDAQKFLQNR